MEYIQRLVTWNLETFYCATVNLTYRDTYIHFLPLIRHFIAPVRLYIIRILFVQHTQVTRITYSTSAVHMYSNVALVSRT